MCSPRARKRAREDEDGLERYLRDLGHRGDDAEATANFDEMPLLFGDGEGLPYPLADLPDRRASRCFL